MNIRISLGMAIALMLMFGAVIFSITRDYTAREYTQKINDLRARETTQAKYAEIDREVREAYYGAGAIDETLLLDSVARGYIQGIGDPYANYIDARTNERLLRSEDNQLADIGALIEANPDGDGYLIVREVYPDSPAQGADILAGDLIVRVEDTELTPENSLDMLDAISGELGSRVSLTVRRGSSDTVMALTRRVVPAPTVYSQMLENDVGYLLIKDFADNNTVEQFRRELNNLTVAGARAVIFDVRDNPGTRLDTTARVLNRILPPGAIYSEERRENDQLVTNVVATSDTTELDLPIVVLVNGGSASGAELFAQALWDYDRARIVGTGTAGRGVVLETITLSDGSAIEITVAKVIPPGGETYDEVGIKPDYDVSMEDDWQNLPFDLDAQLKKAHEVAVSMQRAVTVTPDPDEEASQPEETSQPEVDPSQLDEPEEPDESSQEESGDSSEPDADGDGDQDDDPDAKPPDDDQSSTPAEGDGDESTPE